MENIGIKIRTLRERRGLLLRELSAKLNIDTALLSKIERGERVATRKQIVTIAKFFELNVNEILSLWLGEKIAYELIDEDVAIEALKVAEETVKYLKK